MTETSTGPAASDPVPDSVPAADGLADLDLTPRAPGRNPGELRKRRSYRNIAVLSVIAVVLGFVLYQALTNARVFYLNVDEAVARQSELGGQTFRMQGEVMEVDGADATGALVFTMAFGEASATVRHLGDEPSDLFGVGQKVVVDGHWDGQTFESGQILLKHSEEYVEENPDRLDYDVTPTTSAA